MSKEPEVGDVWIHIATKFKFRITSKEENGWVSVIWYNGYSDKLFIGGNFDFYNIYLGKSKANIDDLFKTENEQ